MKNPLTGGELEGYLTCPRGLEELSAAQITPFTDKVKAGRGGVRFTADLKGLYAVNLHSRTGMYALIKLCEITAGNDRELYEQITELPWFEWMAHDTPFSIRTRGNSQIFPNSNYFTLKVKDAIVDSIRRKTKRRPNIDRDNPLYSLVIFVDEKRVQIFLNSSGTPLSKRGYRSEKIHKAALNEALAAGIILLTGWNKDQPFYDPMCGSGTFPIEAALLGRNIPPGSYRKTFAFKKWKNFNPRLWNQLQEEGKAGINHEKLQIFGYDGIGENIRLAETNLRNILLKQWVKFKRQDFEDFNPGDSGGMVIMNPPYGVRLGEEEELKQLYTSIGEVLKQNCIGMEAFIFTGNKEMSQYIGLKSKRRHVLKNGKIDCRLLQYPISQGTYTD